MISIEAIIEAKQRIAKHIRKTPIVYSPALSKLCGCEVYLKCEHEQVTGSFKVRGALNKLLLLDARTRERGIVAASTGNHARAVLHAARLANTGAVLFLPVNAAPSKIQKIHALINEQPPGAAPVVIELHGNDCMETEQHARGYADRSSMTYVSPYNDPFIIAGQGTIAIELLEQQKDITSVLVPVGGGGLISGIAYYLKNHQENRSGQDHVESSNIASRSKDAEAETHKVFEQSEEIFSRHQKEKSIGKGIKIYGCQPEASPVMAESMKAGTIIQMESKETLSEGTAGGIEPNAMTFDLCREYVDDFFIVTEEEIAHAMNLIMEHHHAAIEGAAALPVASLFRHKSYFKDERVVLVLSGIHQSN